MVSTVLVDPGYSRVSDVFGERVSQRIKARVNRSNRIRILNETLISTC